MVNSQPDPTDRPDAAAGPRSRLSEHSWLLGAFLVPILVYLPVVIAEYGFSESYRLLAFYDGGPALRHLVVAEGRPLYAVWAAAMFGFLSGSIRALSLVRLVNVICIGTAASLLAAVLRRAGLGRAEAMLGGVAILMLPSFQLFAGTAAMGGAIVAAALAAVAALTVAPEPRRETGSDPRARPVEAGATAGSLIGPALWLVAAQAMYQPAALIYFALAGALLLLPDLEREVFRRRLARFAFVGGLSMVVAFAFFLIGRALYPDELIGAPRGQLTFDPLAKLAWFFGLPMAHATNLWVLRPNVMAGVLLTIGLSAGLSLKLRAGEDRWLKIVLALGLIPLCYLPNLSVAENHSSFRSQPALATLVLCFDIIIVHRILAARRRVFLLVMTAATAFACFTAGSNVLHYIVRPQVRELQLVRATLGRLPPDHEAIGVIKADFRDTLAPAVFYDEFGYPSTALPWSFTEVTWLVLREQAMAAGRGVPGVVDVRGAANRDAPIVPPTVRPDTIIDWGDVLRTDLAARDSG